MARTVLALTAVIASGSLLTDRPEVRFRGQTGNILLILNITGFDPDRTQTGLAGCEITPIPPDATSPIGYPAIRPGWRD
jgi:hypothetical protein